MLDPITSKLLKEVLPEVIDPILAIINLSLSLGYFHKTFKLAVIKPLIKKTQLDPKDQVNYRLISNLPFLSNILENRLSSYVYSLLEKNMASVRISSQDLDRFIQVHLNKLECHGKVHLFQ